MPVQGAGSAFCILELTGFADLGRLRLWRGLYEFCGRTRQHGQSMENRPPGRHQRHQPVLRHRAFEENLRHSRLPSRVRLRRSRPVADHEDVAKLRRQLRHRHNDVVLSPGAGVVDQQSVCRWRLHQVFLHGRGPSQFASVGPRHKHHLQLQQLRRSERSQLQRYRSLAARRFS